jgi:hypothetical protein
LQILFSPSRKIKENIMIVNDKVTQLPTSLERVGRRIDQAWQRISGSEQERIEGSLELAQALADGRKQFRADNKFSEWLKKNRHDHVNHQDRAALINLASDLTLAREVLTKTERRSYRLIWEEAKDRFTSAGKPDKPKRGRKSKGRHHKPRDATEKTAASKMLDEGKSRTEVVAETGLSDHVVQLAMERELGRRETLDSLLDAAAAKNFSDKSQLKLDDAIRIHKVRIDKQFEQRVNDEVRRRIEAAADATRAENKRLRQENINLTRIVNQRGVFTSTQFNQMKMLCHPDSPASDETKAILLNILLDNKQRLIKGE